MKKVFAYKRIYLLVLIPISFLLTLIAKKSSYFAEQIYAKHIYKWISQIISSITGVLPISLAELLIIALPVVSIILILRFILRVLLEKDKRGEMLLKVFLNIICVGSVALFLFTTLAGINYYRNSFATYSNLEIHDSSVDELFSLTESLALEANELRAQTTRTDENGVFQLSMKNTKLAKLANHAYELLAEEYPILGGYYGAPKPILLSKIMSQTQITGVFIPFTMEANVNIDVPNYSIPATMLHELAHLRGFMREDEANFLSYLAGTKSENPEIRYSTTMLALIIAGNSLYSQDTNLYFQIRELYSEDVLRDIRANSAYWQRYEDTAISTISNKINDTYLKANAQVDGVKSYGRMLDLLLAKYRKDQNENNE